MKQYNFNGVIATMEEYILNIRLNMITSVSIVSAIDSGYKRRKFNQMDHQEQMEYITSLYKKRVVTVWLGATGYDVTQNIYKKLLAKKESGEVDFEIKNNYREDYIQAARDFMKY